MQRGRGGRAIGLGEVRILEQISGECTSIIQPELGVLFAVSLFICSLCECSILINDQNIILLAVMITACGVGFLSILLLPQPRKEMKKAETLVIEEDAVSTDSASLH